MSRELRRLRLPVPSRLDAELEAFDCCGERWADDEIAQEVRAYLAEGTYLHGIEEDITSTFLFLETDESPPLLIGYAALALGVVKLSAGEKRNIGEPPFSDFGAVRLVMIGTNAQYQKFGYGGELLDAVVGLARSVRETIAVRFMVADCNLNLQKWYEDRRFEVNRSTKENDPDQPGNTVSMRLDLRKRDE